MKNKAQINDSMFKNNKDLVQEIIEMVKKDEKRNKALENAIDRNGILTSDYTLPFLTIKVYHEGFYLIFEGCRCKYSIFAEDNDSYLKLKRKPNENKLHLIYECNGDTEDIIEL